MSEEKKDGAVALSSGSGGGSKLMTALVVMNTLVCLGIAGVLFVSFSKEKSVQKIDDIASEEAHAGGENGGGGGGHGEAAGGHGAPAGGHGEAPSGHGAPEGGHGGAGGGKKLSAFGKMVTLDQFTVNLSTPGSATPKYVRVNISLEVPDASVEGEITQKMPQVRNTIIDLFNSKRPADLIQSEGRDYLKEEIRSALNGFMTTGKVKGVFFTNFALSS